MSQSNEQPADEDVPLIKKLPRMIGRAIVVPKPDNPKIVGLIFPRDASPAEMYAWLQELKRLVESAENTPKD
jgi:hypothetical protein